ncbi:helix-turn-helix transcriptional regulator [Aquihabitans sp. G128]|uniref:helix-turn-helix transcriptional regulator n=1 Tax=Aquihabitans sp. G128 TaxID=2849779 RepID=UPI001C2321A6|nr:helix-turn-helix transcriptional regulator [Aquihabitans sp. G128]QXC60622.1 helix-turn-helix transcriptional regulator [Aquihabitans sp. G128]
MTGSWIGEIVLGSGWLRYEGPVVSTETHAHHAVQIIDALQSVEVRSAAGAITTARLLMIPADAAHQLTAEGQFAVMTYLEPTLVSTVSAPDPAAWARTAESLGLGLGSGLAEQQVELLLARLGSAGALAADELVAAAAEEVRKRLPGPIRLTDIAAALSISPSRLSHRFSTARGIPLGRWVLWERLQLAASATARAQDLTSAAHAAGFADSSHLHRTFRRMFGIAPSDVARIARWRLSI